MSVSENKSTVGRYLEGFRTSTRADPSCLTDDVEWEMPGAFHLSEARVRKEIENDAFGAGRPSPRSG